MQKNSEKPLNKNSENCNIATKNSSGNGSVFATKKNSEKSKVVRKKDSGNSIVVATIVLCFMVTLGLCYMFTGEGFLQTFKKTEGVNFYAVCAGSYKDIKLARASADLLKQRGGAGYVLTADNNIQLVLAVYPDRATADGVLSTLGDRTAYIIEVPVAAGKFKWCKKDKKTAVANGLKYFNVAYDKMFNLANNLADSILTVNDVKCQIDVLSEQIDDIKRQFYQNIAGDSSDEVTEIKLAIVTCQALIGNIVYAENVAKTASSLRYQTVQLVYCYQALMSKI